MDYTVRSRRDVHREVTDKIVAAIEAGANDYEVPWHRSVTRPINAVTEKPYHGGERGCALVYCSVTRVCGRPSRK